MFTKTGQLRDLRHSKKVLNLAIPVALEMVGQSEEDTLLNPGRL